MTKRNNGARAGAERDTMATLNRQIAGLASKSTDALASQYEAITGQPTNSRNKGSLVKRVAYALQAQAFGGLSQGARIKISELGDTLPEAWHARLVDTGNANASAPATVPQVSNGTHTDPRLPPVGATLQREYKGKVHTVTILASGFEYDGQTYKTLSEVACTATGKKWSGQRFFRIEK